MDFMLMHGNDWFFIPLEQPVRFEPSGESVGFERSVGSLCRVDSLVVHDVFGGATLVERADAAPGPPGQRWTMFSTSVEGQPSQLADFFMPPLTTSTAAQAGPAVEEVRFMRDEMANMAWAIERATENGIGQPWPGHERDLAARAVTQATTPPPPGPDEDDKPPLRYQIQTSVPINWIPFLPVAINARGDVALEIAEMLGRSGQPVKPEGKILNPTNLNEPALYRVREEEVPRSGVNVSRVVCRSRWTDGSTHLWVARRKTAGAGEGRSGLRFDLAVPD